MRAFRNLTDGAVALLLATMVMMPTGAQALTAELARKCSALMAKEFPPREPGNPAAGSAKGNGQAARDYYQKCIDSGGNINSGPEKNEK